MTTIGEALDREWATIRHHPPRHRYDHPNATQRYPETPVSLIDTIRTEIATAAAWGEDELRARLPTVAKLADDAAAIAASPLAQTVLAAVLPPADEAWLVSVVQRLDQSAHQAGQAAALADAEPAPGDPALAPAGPVVGGQA